MSITQLNSSVSEEALKRELGKAYALDRVRFCREVLPHWFPKPMPWFHRGILAILVRNADFLLNFGDEEWAEGKCRWTKKHLAKIVRHFTYPLDPSVHDSPQLPIFEVEYKKDGRTPVAIHMTLGQFTNLLIPRGFSKTTLTNAAVMSMALFLEVKFPVYISHAARHAESQLDNIRRELQTNETILWLFGDLVPGKQDPQRNAADELELLNGVILMAKGRGSQIRGLLRHSDRPDLIVDDDVEDKDSVATEDQREKTMSWDISDVEQALPKVKGEGRRISLSTVLHSDSLSMRKSRNPKWTTIIFGAMIETKDKDGNTVLEPLWRDRMSVAEFEAERANFVRVGKLYEFGLEYMSTVRLEEKQSFKAHNVQKYRTYSDEEFKATFPVRALACDPAISDNPRAAYCALACIGMKETGLFHIQEVYMRIGMTPSETMEEYFRMSIAYDCTRHGVEGIAYQTALIHLIRENMFRKQRYFEIDPKIGGRMPGTDKKKHIRVEGILQPRYAAGLITHNQRWPIYEGQLLDWPHQRKDGPDVVAMAVALCDPYAGMAHEDPNALMAESTMEPLGDMDGRFAP